MSSTLYLIDGMSHIYRAYHAIRGLSNREGLPTNAVFGFTNMLRKLIQEEQPDYLGVAIDVAGPTVRHQQYEEYKATRAPMPDDLALQIPYVLKVCEVLRIPVLSQEGYEADDVIGTLAARAREKGLEVVIVTIDKDMFQLVGEGVTVLDTRTMTRLDAAGVEQKFGVPPSQVVDVLSLMGDSSDNIPGAPGIGQKGARQLIRQYGSLEELLGRRQEVKRKSYRESLVENEPLILQSRELVTIRKDLDLQFDLEALALCEPDREAARELFARLNFTKLLDEFLPAPAAASARYQALQEARAVEDLARQIQGQIASLALFLEGENPREPRLTGLAVSAGPQEGCFLSRELIEREPRALENLFASPRRWIVHDLKPFHILRERLGWPSFPPFQDTMLMAYLLDPDQKDFSLHKLAVQHLGRALKPACQPGEGLFEDFVEFASEQAEAAGRLFEVLRPQLEERGLERLLEEVEIPLVRVLASMEMRGVRVDCELLRAMSAELEEEIARLTRSIHEMAGEEFNINSPRQLASILYEKLHLPVVKKTKKGGHYATGVEVLKELAATHEIVRFILEYRELTKLKNTYLDALPRLVDPETGRIHTSYNQMVAATGRLSSSNPNLQNIPIKGEQGRRIRRAFVAEPGFLILSADYSQIELRVMAHLSGDPVLVDAFLRGEDIHERTAREVFGMRAMMNPREYRRHAKVINFGILYGLSAFGLAKSLEIDRKEAQQFIDDYFERYQGVKSWIEKTLATVRETGYVRTLFGRIRRIPEIHSRNRNLRNFGERTAINAPIQGTAADLIKMAMVEVDRTLRERRLESRLIMQVHDELVFEAREGEVDEIKELVRQSMEGAAQLSVPLKVDLHVGKSWFE